MEWERCQKWSICFRLWIRPSHSDDKIRQQMKQKRNHEKDGKKTIYMLSFLSQFYFISTFDESQVVFHEFCCAIRLAQKFVALPHTRKKKLVWSIRLSFFFLSCFSFCCVGRLSFVPCIIIISAFLFDANDANHAVFLFEKK